MASLTTLAGIIFDMDGVLCDSEPFICEAAMRMFRETHDVEVMKADFAPFVGTGEDRFIGGVAEKYGVKLTMPRDKERTYAIYLEIISGRLQPLPGAVQFIVDVRKAGMKLAVATSADRVKLEGNLTQIGVPSSTFDAIVTGSDVARKKPDPEVFRLAAERLQLPPEDCLVIEDAPSGIRAGKLAGSRCLGLTTSFSEEILRAAGADFIAADLSGVPVEALASSNTVG